MIILIYILYSEKLFIQLLYFWPEQGIRVPVVPVVGRGRTSSKSSSVMSQISSQSQNDSSVVWLSEVPGQHMVFCRFSIPTAHSVGFNPCPPVHVFQPVQNIKSHSV